MKKISLLILTSLVFFGFCLFYFQPSKAQSVQEPTNLFNIIGMQKTESSVSLAGVREQEIKINFDKINFETTEILNIPLLDGKFYKVAQRDSEGFERFASGEFTWRGKISGDNNWSGDVVLTVKGEVLSGLIYSPNAVYEIIPQENFKHLLVEIDQSRFPECGGAIVPEELKLETKDNANKQKSPLVLDRSTKNLFETSKNNQSILNSPQSSLVVDDGSLIDVMVVYTAAVRNFLGGTTQAQTFAQQAVASTNTAYQNSGVATRLRLVQTMEVSYADNGTAKNALDWVTDNATVAAARNTAKADLVSILTENVTDFCGVAWTMPTLSTSFAPRGFSQVSRSCALGNLTFAHELGHNQSLHHNPENAGTSLYPYGYGHQQNGVFATVMAYPKPINPVCTSPNGCPKIPYFSNPNVTFSSLPTGIANQRESFRAINNTALTVSQFRDSGGGGCPTTPISSGQTINASLTTTDCTLQGRGYVDIYTFNGTAGQRISVSMNSSAFDTYLYLINSSNQNLSEDDDGGGGTNSRIPATSEYFTLSATGTYSIYATSFDANRTGAYSISLTSESGGQCPTTSINVGQTINGSLTTSDCVFTGTTRYVDTYTFNGSSGQQISISMNSSAIDTYVYLYNSSNQVIESNDDDGGGTNSRIPAISGFFTLPTTGNYTIIASSFAPNETGAYTLTLSNNQPNSRRAFDFDGDGKSDISVFRPSNGAWYLNQSTDGFRGVQFGISSDKVASADFDGDGKTDIAVFRPSTGSWYWLNSSNGSFSAVSFGINGDLPVPADFDGDGKADVAVFRPSNGVWYLLGSSQGFTGVQFGQNGDKPMTADYDGDGKSDVAVVRQANGVSIWYIFGSIQGFYGVQFGTDTDKLVPADYDGDGKADIAVYRNGVWYLLRSQLGFTAVSFGTAEDKPVAADYDGDGKADIAVFRPSNGNWYLLQSTAGFAAVQFGVSEDSPTPNAFVR